MKDNGLLSKGDLYEVGRADLVGQYVGHTAPLVKKRFKEAEGSVLFIDEAYSLVDDRDGMYGDEAISTIVQEMENNRDNMVVIFAGYPDKMEKFMKTNPGLRSRIAFHVHFPDYATDDLCRIAELIAKDDGLYLAPEARAKLTGIFDSARKTDDFGNGRYVRNLIENAHMEQCNRLAGMNVSDVTDDDIKMLAPEDIVAPNISPYDGNAHRFGFAV
jgi:SpoVK/Ycf46/Vps4 family AAA+-type ATPase